MNESEQRVRQVAGMNYVHASIMMADLRELLRLLDEARADLARVTDERDKWYALAGKLEAEPRT